MNNPYERLNTPKDDDVAEIIHDCLSVINLLENWELDLYDEEVAELRKKFNELHIRVQDNVSSDI